MEALSNSVAAIIGADDRAGIASRVLTCRDLLVVKRRALLNLMTPIRDAQGATRAQAILDRVAHVDHLLSLLLACYEEEVGASWNVERLLANAR